MSTFDLIIRASYTPLEIRELRWIIARHAYEQRGAEAREEMQGFWGKLGRP